MDEHLGTENSDEIADTTVAIIEETSTEYLGRWNRLVSTTNWEKGRIISEWRERLIQSEAPAQTYSDEAWSRTVGNVSGQHAGRLRRVWDRFAQVFDQYEGLYWSHFQAAVDWDDAEMYLVGAKESGWSVAQMRSQRWEAMGALADDKPVEEDIVSAELDEDAGPVDDADMGDASDEVESAEGFDRADGSEFEPSETSEDAPFDDSADAAGESDSAGTDRPGPPV